MTKNRNKIILDLCGGTGAWSRPYAEAGYDVRVITLPYHDVRSYEPPEIVYGVLAAPPCTMFSYARTRAKAPRDFTSGLEVVNACLRIIHKCIISAWDSGNGKRFKFWALENPYSYLRRFLGTPAMEFHPFEFGDFYSKRTCLWGEFNRPERINVSLPLRIRSNYMRDMSPTDRQVRRAITPPSFARAFFEANQ